MHRDNTTNLEDKFLKSEDDTRKTFVEGRVRKGLDGLDGGTRCLDGLDRSTRHKFEDYSMSRNFTKFSESMKMINCMKWELNFPRHV